MNPKTYKVIVFCRINLRLLFIPVLLLFASCKKFVSVESPKSKLVAESVFQSDSTAISAMRGVYSMMVNGSLTDGVVSISFLTSLSADELSNYSSDVSQIDFYVNRISTTNSSILNLWSEPFKFIYAVNAIIEGVSESSTISPEVKSQLLAESKFIRAFWNFYLVNLFGDIPLVLTTDYRQNTSISRTSYAEVYKHMIRDLTEAKNLLPGDYSTYGNERIRPNKDAASALLARVYLFSNDMVNSESEASQVINNTSLYDTVPISDVFLKNSRETILQLLPLAGRNTKDGTNFILTSPPAGTSGSSSAISDNLLNAFEAADKRKANWLGTYTTTNFPVTTYYFPYKYKVKQSATQTEYLMMLRIGEQYLIRAEARIHQNKIEQGVRDLNILRKRSGLVPLSTTLSKEEALLAVEQERRVELFTEWGHRWLDLKRTNRANDVMPSITASKGGLWKSEWQLYPIPQSQILNDPAMRDAQNPGYD